MRKFVVIAALVLTGCSSGAASPTSALAQTIHVLEHPTTWSEVKVASLSGCKDTTCQGDYLVGHSSMTDAVTNEEVGTFVTECFLVDVTSGLYHCPASTLDMPGRGQIVFDETVYIGKPGAPDGPWPIIGGTGEFLGATGSVTSPPDSTWTAGDFVITFTK